MGGLGSPRPTSWSTRLRKISPLLACLHTTSSCPESKLGVLLNLADEVLRLMGTQKNGPRLAGTRSLSMTTGNKLKRQELFVRHKQSTEKQRREDRLRRRKQEDANPGLRKERLENNVPASIDRKRIWDDVDDDSLGAVVDVAKLKRRRLEGKGDEASIPRDTALPADRPAAEDELESMLGSDDEFGNNGDGDGADGPGHREPSLAPSTTSTNLDLTPASLAQKFPGLFGADDAHPTPKILVTTTLNSTLHQHAAVLCNLFPNSHYVPRSRHRYGHKVGCILDRQPVVVARELTRFLPVLTQGHQQIRNKPRLLSGSCTARRPEKTFGLGCRPSAIRAYLAILHFQLRGRQEATGPWQPYGTLPRTPAQVWPSCSCPAGYLSMTEALCVEALLTGELLATSRPH